MLSESGIFHGVEGFIPLVDQEHHARSGEPGAPELAEHAGPGGGHRHQEPEHGDNIAKFWLDPVAVGESRGFRLHELNRVRALVIEHRLIFLEAWNAHFGRQG